VAITGVRGSEFTYDLAFEPIAELSDDHVRYLIGELSVAIPQDSVERMMGSTLDLPKTEGQGGLVIRNPNRADPLANITVDLTGELPEQVATLLAEHINPSLAAHGGFAELVGVDEDKNVYVTMGGGCQGCSLSAATLQDGIRSAIKSNIPEILEVIDATDHTAGQNPFYT
jgi:Fe/S biogenesis protein NfuA